MPGTRLDLLLDGIEGTLADLPVVPPSGCPNVVGLAILDPDDELGDHHDELVLVIGVRGRESLPFLRAAARGGAVAVAVKTGPSGAVGELASAAAEAGVALLAVRPQVRWDRLGALLRERLEAFEFGAELGTEIGAGPGAELEAGPAGGPASDPSGQGLFALAEATALVTGGIVSIEDAGNRVLAYSRSEDGVDELRRLSILGWQGPENYMAMLREWGVLARLRAGEQVVRVEEHPELGVRPRLAIGIRAGPRYLGTIWVQQRFDPVTVPFAEKAEDALVGAARLAATEILRRRAGAAAGGAAVRGHLVELLTGRANTDLVAGRLGLDPAAPALVVAFDGPLEADVPSRELHQDQVRGVVSMYATAYHRTALVDAVDGRVYAVLSGVAADRVEPALLSWVSDVVDVVRSRTGLPWRAGVGSPVPTLARLPAARAEADRVLDALARASAAGGGAGPSVATISELRAEVLLGELLDLLEERPELRHPGVAALVEHDTKRGGELVESLLAYLDALGDVRSAAATLHVHPNTLRHRLRRARAVSGMAMDDPRERLSCHLQLVLVSRLARRAGRPPARTRPAP